MKNLFHAFDLGRRITGITIGTPGGRLTTESGVTLPSSDRLTQGTIYYTPYLHNNIYLYNGSRWNTYNFSEFSLSLTGVISGTVYDVFAYDDGGTPSLELMAWKNATVTMTIASPCVVTWNSHGMSNNDIITFSTTGSLPTGVTAGTQYFVSSVTTNSFQLVPFPSQAAINSSGSQSGTHTGWQGHYRQTDIVRQDGVYVKSGAPTRLYLGTIRASATNQTEQSRANYFIWNYYNRLPIISIDSDGTVHTYTSSTPRRWNNSDGAMARFVLGVLDQYLQMRVTIRLDPDIATNFAPSGFLNGISPGSDHFVQIATTGSDNITGWFTEWATSSNMGKLGLNVAHPAEADFSGTPQDSLLDTVVKVYYNG